MIAAARRKLSRLLKQRWAHREDEADGEGKADLSLQASAANEQSRSAQDRGGTACPVGEGKAQQS